MRAAMWLLALFALAVAFTLLARFDQGYVIVVFPPWRIELSFMLAVLLLSGMAVLIYFMLRLLGIALNLSGDMRAWRVKRRQIKADQALFDAIRAYLDGDQKQVEKLAIKAAQSTLAPDVLQRLLTMAAIHSESAAGPVQPAKPLDS